MRVRRICFFWSITRFSVGPVALAMPAWFGAVNGFFARNFCTAGSNRLLGIDIAGERVARPVGPVLAGGERIVDRQRARAGLSAERKVAVVHRGRGDGGPRRGGPAVLEVALAAGQPERPVAALVSFGSSTGPVTSAWSRGS